MLVLVLDWHASVYLRESLSKRNWRHAQALFSQQTEDGKNLPMQSLSCSNHKCPLDGNEYAFPSAEDCSALPTDTMDSGPVFLWIMREGLKLFFVKVYVFLLLRFPNKAKIPKMFFFFLPRVFNLTVSAFTLSQRKGKSIQEKFYCLLSKRIVQL